jgi:hypothetical protein
MMAPQRSGSARPFFGRSKVELGVSSGRRSEPGPNGLLLDALPTNAFKYGASGERPEVCVAVRAEEGLLRLVVHDSGPGLPEGFRLERGTSLGLQLVRASLASSAGRWTRATREAPGSSCAARSDRDGRTGGARPRKDERLAVEARQSPRTARGAGRLVVVPSPS